MTAPAAVGDEPPPVDGDDEMERFANAVASKLAGQIITFTTPGDVRALQGQIKSDLEAVRSSLQRCASSGTFTPDKTPGDWNAWQSMKERAQQFVDETPALLSTVSQYQRGELVQKELATWHDKAKGFGCDAGPAPMVTAPPTSSSFFAGFDVGSITTIALLYFLFKASKGR